MKDSNFHLPLASLIWFSNGQSKEQCDFSIFCLKSLKLISYSSASFCSYFVLTSCQAVIHQSFHVFFCCKKKSTMSRTKYRHRELGYSFPKVRRRDRDKKRATWGTKVRGGEDEVLWSEVTSKRALGKS